VPAVQVFGHKVALTIVRRLMPPSRQVERLLRVARKKVVGFGAAIARLQFIGTGISGCPWVEGRLPAEERRCTTVSTARRPAQQL
jgi:hypothetical protein